MRRWLDELLNGRRTTAGDIDSKILPWLNRYLVPFYGFAKAQYDTGYKNKQQTYLAGVLSIAPTTISGGLILGTAINPDLLMPGVFGLVGLSFGSSFLFNCLGDRKAVKEKEAFRKMYEKALSQATSYVRKN